MAKQWLAGPWDSNLPVGIGYATAGADDPHVHPALAEIYLVAAGSSRLRVGRELVDLTAGSVVIVEAGEPHTFLASSPDYLHYVVQVTVDSAHQGPSKLPALLGDLV